MSAMRTARFVGLVLLAVTPLLAADDKKAAKKVRPPAIAVALTAEQKTALQAVDVRLAGVDALVARIDDPAYRAREARTVADLRRRRSELERNFDPMSYESLMHTVISRYQIVALWLTPPREPAPRP